MSDALKVDTGRLREAAQSLSSISGELSHADANAGAVGAAVGHAGLANRLSTFAGGWRIRRAEMEKSVSALSTILVTTADEFEGADGQLAAGVRGGKPSSKPSGKPSSKAGR